MSWSSIHWHSEVLQKHTTVQVLLPCTGRPPWPALYLLHGLSDDSTGWLRNSRLECHVNKLPLMIVMPDGYRSFYTNAAQGPAFAEHIGEELVDFIDLHFQTKASRAGRAIGGLSMGGYGALRVGLGYADRFCSINSHSGAVGGRTETLTALVGAMPQSRTRGLGKELRRIFGSASVNTPHDIVKLARHAHLARHLPAIHLDCGLGDFLLADNRRYHHALIRAGVPHEYHEYAGAHDWDYWERQIKKSLRFHCLNLGVKSVANSC